jgi:peptidoglycan hydrolase-like protein with peptidoglycan-binding domain
MRNMLAASILGLSLCAIPVLPQSQDTVRDAQQALKDKGYDPGPVDGINGPLTRAAVRNYQQKENIDADGRLGPKTLDSLGVKRGSASTEFGAAGEKLKNSYANGAKDVGHGTKEAGSDLKHGDVVEGAKDFGKGVGQGVGKMAVGTGRAAKNAAKGSKKAVTGDSKPKQ